MPPRSQTSSHRSLAGLLGVLALVGLAGLPGSAAAQFETDPVAKAQTFLRNRAEMSLGFIQAGCTLKGVNAATVRRHQDGSFTVGVRYAWSGPDGGNDHSDIHYTFNASGRLRSMQIGDSTAILFTPYGVAEGAIQVLRDAFLQELQNADEQTRRILVPLVRQANAQRIHLLILQYQQPR